MDFQIFLLFFYFQGTRRETVKMFGLKKKGKHIAKSNQPSPADIMERVIKDGINPIHILLNSGV